MDESNADQGELPRETPFPASDEDNADLSPAQKMIVCKQMLLSRLQVIEVMEERLAKIAKYALKLLNERDELAAIISREKDEGFCIASAFGVSTLGTGYVPSYSVLLEQCFEALLEH
ncbi:uncharacterized protein PITG_15910 [Phytophthora infestans T30-4]|uniref:Uncharacterized protein n=1 Tax=Phytophthora infestans (strain T30-4) TaxID=403677 RepID=D0NS14_PHYIT|nr:uncharacterized protein PITG_15910 [Phytophthora infestans T30-4]EEY63555.1 conserved hypothetical protein [Phytophthora infestans T30-4]|eukprot:XP_002898142.1 conserved hypothetical protein [Phytophthora infestans T30-4]